VVAAVDRFLGDDVILSDGNEIAVDAVIAATGYGSGLRPLVGHLGVLDDRERPRFHASVTDPATQGLHFLGFTDPFGGNFRQIRLDALSIARRIAAEVRQRAS
jgi:2-polyprenyl-6-methoxyphenol hydroxylase-like FAD-dependent oxidoreductase